MPYICGSPVWSAFTALCYCRLQRLRPTRSQPNGLQTVDLPDHTHSNYFSTFQNAGHEHPQGLTFGPYFTLNSCPISMPI